MFSALKKFTTKSTPDAIGNGGQGAPHAASLPNPPNTTASPGGMQTMDASLQKKFARGVHYNMKLIIKGDRNTGKSCLFHRLQGKAFNEEYVPTDEIQVASIQWNYKAADDIVKVEVWDIVDKGRKRKQLDGLKFDNASSKFPGVNIEAMEVALDAEFVDVYKGTHGVVFMFDVTKMWTFEYIQREIPKVPPHIPILIMANFIDMGHHRVVTRDQAIGFIEHFDRKEFATNVQQNDVAAEIRYAESSMRNGFGLKLLHKFLNVPYLMLQRETLLTQLALNQREIEGTQLELDLYLESDDANYEVFLDGVTKKRRQAAEVNAPKPTVDIVAGQPSHTITTKTTDDKSKAREDSAKKGLEVLAAIQMKQDEEKLEKEKRASPLDVSSTSEPPKTKNDSTIGENQSAVHNEINVTGNKKVSPGKESLRSLHSIGTGSINSHLSSKHTTEGVDVDNFVPNFGDDSSVGGIDNFLDSEMIQSDSKSSFNKENSAYNQCDDSSDDDEIGRNNPMVAKIMADDSDIEIDDILPVKPIVESNKSRISTNYESSSSSEDDRPGTLDTKEKVSNDNLRMPNPLVKKLSDVSISGSSEKSSSSKKSTRSKKYDDRKDDNSDNNDFIFDLKGLSTTNVIVDKHIENVSDSDEKPKKSRKKHKKEKKEKSSSSKKSKKVKDERDDLEEFLNGNLSNKDNSQNCDEIENHAAPEGYDEL